MLHWPIETVPQELIFPLLQEDNQKVRNLAVQVLSRCHHPAIPAFIISGFPTASTETKRLYLHCLEILGAKSASLVLVDCLLDPNSEIRGAVARLLCVFGEEAVMLAVEKFPKWSREDKVKVVRAFGQVLKGGLQIFEVALGDEDFWVRKETINALKSRSGAGPTRLLLRGLEDESPLVRIDAVRSLREPLPQQVRAVLLTLESDPNDEVAAAAQALRGWVS